MLCDIRVMTLGITIAVSGCLTGDTQISALTCSLCDQTPEAFHIFKIKTFLQIKVVASIYKWQPTSRLQATHFK